VCDGIGAVETELQPFLHLSVEVDTRIETTEVGVDDRTLLVVVATTYIIMYLVGTTLSADLMGILPGCPEDGVLPVSTAPEDRRVAVRLVCTIRVYLVLINEAVVEFCELAEVEDVEAFVLTADGHGAVVGEFSVSALSFLRSDEHDTIGTLCTVDGCGGSILEHLDAHNVGRSNEGEGRDGRVGAVAESISETEAGAAVALSLDDDTINDIQWVATGVDGCNTTY